jgi:hypothetical protein
MRACNSPQNTLEMHLYSGPDEKARAGHYHNDEFGGEAKACGALPGLLNKELPDIRNAPQPTPTSLKGMLRSSISIDFDPFEQLFAVREISTLSGNVAGKILDSVVLASDSLPKWLWPSFLARVRVICVNTSPRVYTPRLFYMRMMANFAA